MDVASPSPTRVLESPAGTVRIFGTPERAAQAAAEQLATAVRAALSARGRCVLGLATGATPIRVYERLVALHRVGALPFHHVHTYNLDEYYPISPVDPNSYRSYMHRHLFAHVDLPANHAHLLDGTVPEHSVAAHCAEYERWIAADGGLDVQLLGIGRNGHIGFNEPADLELPQALDLKTRLVELDAVTIEDSAGDFGGRADRVPRRALTMGVRAILSARSIVMVAFGPAKRQAVERALHGEITMQLPASLLQRVRDRVTWFVDGGAVRPT